MSLLLAAPLAGCLGFGPPSRDYGIPQYVLVPGTGYTFYPLEGSTHGFIQSAAISPNGSVVALMFRSSEVELWSGEGRFLRTLMANGTPGPCGVNLSVAKFVNESAFVGFLGSCPVLMSTNGTVLAEADWPGGVDFPERTISADGMIIAAHNYTDVIVKELLGTRNVSVPRFEPNRWNAVDYYSLSPDGKLLATVTDATRFYRIDLALLTATRNGEFPRAGHVFFSVDGLSAVQDVGEYGVGPNSIAFYNLSGRTIQVEEHSCDRSPGQTDWPLCPRLSALEAVSASGRFLGWPNEFDVFWMQEDAAGRSSGNHTKTTVVHILERNAANASHGFQAGPPVVEPIGSPGGDSPSRPSVVALRIFADGSALAISTQGDWPYSVFLTRAEAGSTLPTSTGRTL